MRLGIFGRASDPLSAHTAARARARGHEVLEVSFSELREGAPGAVTLDGDGASWLWKGDELDCDAYVLRRYPAPTAQLGPPEESATAAEWYRKGVKQQERSTFAQSAIMDLELRGKPIVNPLLATQPYEHKPLQLAVFHRAGLPIPRTVITNWPDAARILEDSAGPLIAKPAAGGAETLVVDDDVRAKLPGIVEAPVIFQERVVGHDVRVTVVGERVVSAVVIESDHVDYRAGDAYRRGDAHYAAHALPAAAEAMCLRAAALCKHVLSGIDLKLRADGSYALLEANSAPVYLDIEQKTGAPITDAILDWLASRLG